MPAGFGGVAAHALGHQNQTSGAARLCRQLQSPPMRQAKRLINLANHQAHRARTQRLFGRSQKIYLRLGLGQKDARWVAILGQTNRVELLRRPVRCNPQRRFCTLVTAACRKIRRAGAANLMGAAALQRVDGSEIGRHVFPFCSFLRMAESLQNSRGAKGGKRCAARIRAGPGSPQPWFGTLC